MVARGSYHWASLTLCSAWDLLAPWCHWEGRKATKAIEEIPFIEMWTNFVSLFRPKPIFVMLKCMTSLGPTRGELRLYLVSTTRPLTHRHQMFWVIHRHPNQEGKRRSGLCCAFDTASMLPNSDEFLSIGRIEIFVSLRLTRTPMKCKMPWSLWLKK